MKTIRCYKCNASLGEIRDAKIKKGTVYFCGDCKAKESFANIGRKGAQDPMDLFNGIFSK